MRCLVGPAQPVDHGRSKKKLIAILCSDLAKMSRIFPETGRCMPKIFISYRRQDSSKVAMQLRGRLEGQFQPGSVFYDIDSIPKGVDFRDRLSAALKESDALLAVIGHGWFDAAYEDGPKQGQRRLDGGVDDYVRIEIEDALALGVPLIPVLVEALPCRTARLCPAE